MKRTVTIAALALVLAACGDVEAAPEPTPEPVESAPAVETPAPEPEPEQAEDDFWSLAPYGDGLSIKEYVDELAADADCAGLQGVFDVWADADHVQDFTPAVLEYVDEALAGAGCYE